MSSAFLGRGWAFPVRPAGPAAPGVPIALSDYEESIRDAVWIVLGTARGERPMRPDFGCGIHQYVFATSSATTLGLVTREVRDALVRWEPRIDVLNVDAASDPADPRRLLVSVDYRVRTTNNQFNLVYPFYLEKSAA
jgi:phage baseplate assembly protein W